jgi:glutathione synthase/RimK-type ligase-like ATP-grasp enzyme
MEYVIENPSLGYGRDYIRAMHRRFGAKAVCLYTREVALPKSAKLQPELFSKQHVAASYRVKPTALPSFIEHLRRHHVIKAVIPSGEAQVLHAITIAEALGLEWVQPEIMRRFRDKFALKAHLRATDPGLRINHAELASSPDEALQIVQRNRLTRFVLKPNDGCANVHVGMFSTDDPKSLIEEYWQRTGAGTVLLEEFIDGPEFHCNGQVDAEGTITIIDIGRTQYAETSDHGIVRTHSAQMASTMPDFARISEYVRRVISASGLRRSPFHAELRVDEIGPSLLECAARLMGGAWARFGSFLHGPAFDMVGLAAHYYTSAKPYGPPGLDWHEYNSSVLMKVRGFSTRSEKIMHLSGVHEAERLPQFLAWMDKPFQGQRLVESNSLNSMAYSLMMRCRNPAEADEVEHTVRGLVKWNKRPLSVQEKASYYAKHLPGYLRCRFNLKPGPGRRFFDHVFE